MLSRPLVSRVLLLRSLKNSADNVKQVKRNGSHGVWSYRVVPPMPSKRATLLAEVLGGFAWWWIFFHIFTEPEHVYGEWPYIDPSTWTDEELGIPPDSQGSLPRINV
ncbi:NADH dehydrogenase [ubiquinone] 1 beta subcomplex subunit 2, mitochondrial-like [Hyposmocoma kahamanoa]|uniref:NADH dehydrogenase [ubiquinone] 1 beta subcomplex subunit 2, mitochondrial-like n=1 Tax=Hyposmocoma kahamanoa TaxID=1477025 RepID=UPI000E6D8094|nr:NADH dehydrogenase [ubiquinone] 1 beta subcomplex subunit 2, mitochondrial-like [Hyposmocoma kahamanoa]